MSKQKYYVKLKEEFQATGVTFADMSLYLNENGDFDLKYFAHPLTKSELELISDGVIYKSKWRDMRNDIDFGEGWEMKMDDEKGKSYWEWINPLIKLVPVEEEAGKRNVTCLKKYTKNTTSKPLQHFIVI